LQGRRTGRAILVAWHEFWGLQKYKGRIQPFTFIHFIIYLCFIYTTEQMHMRMVSFCPSSTIITAPPSPSSNFPFSMASLQPLSRCTWWPGPRSPKLPYPETNPTQGSTFISSSSPPRTLHFFLPPLQPDRNYHSYFSIIFSSSPRPPAPNSVAQ